MKQVSKPAVPGDQALARGRPPTGKNRQVAEDIICAAKTCLERCSPQQLTVKQVAEAAGTRPTMIQYYFGGMSGLLDEILRQGLNEVLGKTTEMKAAILNDKIANPLRSMIAMLATSYNQRPALTRILISETLRENSTIKHYFVEQWPTHGKAMMEDIISHLSKKGFYAKDINVEGICAMLRSVIFYPVIIEPYLVREGETIDHYLDDAWIDFVTNVFECYLRPSQKQDVSVTSSIN